MKITSKAVFDTAAKPTIPFLGWFNQRRVLVDKAGLTYLDDGQRVQFSGSWADQITQEKVVPLTDKAEVSMVNTFYQECK